MKLVDANKYWKYMTNQILRLSPLYDCNNPMMPFYYYMLSATIMTHTYWRLLLTISPPLAHLSYGAIISSILASLHCFPDFSYFLV